MFKVALVSWTESVGLTLVKRDLNSMQLKTPHGVILNYIILQIFPFTSETKRMGIIVKVVYIRMAVFILVFNRIMGHINVFFQDESTGEITFYMKGADVVMASIVQYNDWLEEEVRISFINVYHNPNIFFRFVISMFYKKSCHP